MDHVCTNYAYIYLSVSSHNISVTLLLMVIPFCALPFSMQLDHSLLHLGQSAHSVSGQSVTTTPSVQRAIHKMHRSFSSSPMTVANMRTSSTFPTRETIDMP